MSIGFSLHDLPNELIRKVLSHLPSKKRIGVTRVNFLWRLLSNSLLKDDSKVLIKEEYPFYASLFKKTPVYLVFISSDNHA